MPITFRSKHSPDILMLEGNAREFIRMMGHSETLPGSLAHEDIAVALARLEAAVARGAEAPLAADRKGGDVEDDDSLEAPVSAAHRAGPLLAMLRTALAEKDYVIWDR